MPCATLKITVLEAMPIARIKTTPAVRRGALLRRRRPMVISFQKAFTPRTAKVERDRAGARPIRDEVTSECVGLPDQNWADQRTQSGAGRARNVRDDHKLGYFVRDLKPRHSVNRQPVRSMRAF